MAYLTGKLNGYNYFATIMKNSSYPLSWDLHRKLIMKSWHACLYLYFLYVFVICVSYLCFSSVFLICVSYLSFLSVFLICVINFSLYNFAINIGNRQKQTLISCMCTSYFYLYNFAINICT